jgi:hypothetical protein
VGSRSTEFDIESPGGSTTVIRTGVTDAGHLRFANGSSTVTYCTSDDQPTVDGAQFGDALWAVPLGAGTVSPRMLMSGDLSWCEDGAVAGTDVIAELGGGTDTTSVLLINLDTGQATPLAPADYLLGVL